MSARSDVGTITLRDRRDATGRSWTRTQLREMVRSLHGRSRRGQRDREIAFKQATIDKLTHEMAVLKRLKFAAKREALQRRAEEPAGRDARRRPGGAAAPSSSKVRPPSRTTARSSQPKRQPLPAHLPRREIHHEPENTTCACGCALKRIGEDVAEKLDYQPGVFTVERHVRGKWVCAQLRDAGAGAGGAAHHRQGHPHSGPAGPGAGGQVPRSPAAVPPGSHLRARRPGDRALDAGAVGGRVRRAAAAAGRRADGRAADARRAARRRDAGGDAQAGQRQDAPGLPVELLHDALQRDQGGGLRLRRQPRRAACARLPRAARSDDRLARQAGVRRLQRLQGLLRRWA